MKKKEFCINCNADVDYTVSKVMTEGKLSNKKYKYLAKVATCKNCGEELFVPSLHDENLEELYRVFRKENYLVSAKKVREVPEMYNIGKRPLSNLLGWGELTYTRYCDGATPSKHYSAIIKRMHDDPGYFLEILEKNKENLKSKTTYEKSLAACKKLMKEAINKEKKINQVILYILYMYDEISVKALQKTLYYIQGFYYAFYGKYLFSENCEAWAHGPVFKETYKKFYSFKNDDSQKQMWFDVTEFSQEEIVLINGVMLSLACYNGNILEKFTHMEKPWIDARKGVKANERSNTIIRKEAIGKYFKAIKEKYDMINPIDIKKYAQDMFANISL